MKPNGEVEIIDFEYSPEPKRFRIAPDVFEACPDLPPSLFSFVAGVGALNVKNPEVVERLLEFFDIVLFDESAERFRERVYAKQANIGVLTMIKVIHALLEAYGIRPTQPSSDFFTPSTDEIGTGSTAGAPSEVSNPSGYASVVS
jgi:hypothetical protein